MATDVGADVVTNFRTDDLADAAADSSPGARTVARTNRAALEDADNAALTTTLVNTFFNSNFGAVVPTLASADGAAVTCSLRITVNNLETDVLWRLSAAVHGAHDTTFCRTHGLAVGGTDAQKNCKAHNSTDGLYERQNW